MPKTFAIIAAAGNSQRMGGQQSKVLTTLCERPVIAWTLEPFSKLQISTVIMARECDLEIYKPIAASFENVALAVGGATRGESVARGIQYLSQQFAPKTNDIVLVHDGARCLLTSALIERVREATAEKGAVIPVEPVSDTIKRCEQGGRVSGTVDRSQLYAVQTPQGFHFSLIERAYKNGEYQATDDASLVEQFAEVHSIPGEPWNLKITRPADLPIAAALLSLRGSGALV